MKKAFARNLRNHMTDAERVLWGRLRRRQLAAAKFSRQHVFGPYIVDFACLDHKLIIEIDGGQHANQVAEDAQRTRWLKAQGFDVLRFWNNEVLTQTDAVVEKIAANLTSPPS